MKYLDWCTTHSFYIQFTSISASHSTLSLGYYHSYPCCFPLYKSKKTPQKSALHLQTAISSCLLPLLMALPCLLGSGDHWSWGFPPPLGSDFIQEEEQTWKQLETSSQEQVSSIHRRKPTDFLGVDIYIKKWKKNKNLWLNRLQYLHFTVPCAYVYSWLHSPFRLKPLVKATLSVVQSCLAANQAKPLNRRNIVLLLPQPEIQLWRSQGVLIGFP